MYVAVCNVLSDYRHWLKVTFTLTVVMGITWAMNIFFFDTKLVFLAYIMTVFIAGQGIIIFILLVPLSKQVSAAIKVFEVKYIYICI